MGRTISNSKYHSRKIVVDGEKFDSKVEYQRWCELQLLERAKQITDLKRQVTFELIPSQRVGGRVVEKSVKYIADFTYYEVGQYVVEDVKGVKTPEYIIKRKLMLFRHGIQVKEIQYGKARNKKSSVRHNDKR